MEKEIYNRIKEISSLVKDSVSDMGMLSWCVGVSEVLFSKTEDDILETLEDVEGYCSEVQSNLTDILRLVGEIRDISGN